MKPKGQPHKTVADLEASFHRNYTMEPNTGCWLWMGRYDLYGTYLRAHLTWRGKRIRAPRYAFELYHGPIPSGGFVCHKCDVSLCVNPRHLYLGDAKTNAADLRARSWRAESRRAVAVKNLTGGQRRKAQRLLREAAGT